MIGKLTGPLEQLSDGRVLVDVQGVGYVVQCSGRTLGKIAGANGPVTLFIETQVREDAIALIGFFDVAEQSAFQALTTVQGVGARVALSILSTLSPEHLAQAIMEGDKALLSSADGVGPKLAARLTTELKDKAGLIGLPSVVAFPKAAPGSTLANDAVSTLVNLGFRRDQAFSSVMAVIEHDRQAGFDDLLRLALQDLSGKR